MNIERTLRTVSGWACTIVMVLSVGDFATALAQEEGSKGIKAEEFIKDRPAKPVGGRPVAAKKQTYKTSQAAAAVAAAPPPGKVFAQVGVTLWRFRPATSGDKTKELVEEEEGSGKTEWSL